MTATIHCPVERHEVICSEILAWVFLSDPGKPGVRSLSPDVRPSVSEVV